MAGFTAEELEQQFQLASPLIHKLSSEMGQIFQNHLPEKDDKSLLIYPQIIEAALIYHMAVAVELRATLHSQPVDEAIEMLSGGIRVALDQRARQALEEENDE